MGRLLRKKEPGKSRKKKNGFEEAAPLQAKNDASPQPASQPSASSREEGKKGVLPAKKPVAGKVEEGKLQGYLTKSIQFLREVKVELKKVAWPSRKQTIGSTVVVIALVMIVSLFLGLVDIGLSSLVRVVLQ